MRRVMVLVGVVLALLAGWWWRARTGGVRPQATERGGAVEHDALHRRGALDAKLHSLASDDPPGALQLEGQVIADGRGVAGATVVISTNPPRTALSEADGSFVFDHLSGRQYTLVARAATGVAGPVATWLSATSDPVILTIKAAARLTVEVVDRDNKPVDGAVVELRGIDVQRAVMKDRSVVFAPVAPGDYQVAAWAAGTARTFDRIQVGSSDADARLVLVPGAAVSGRVIDESGGGVAGAWVRYQGASDWTQQADERLDGERTGADGSFRFHALPAGSFRFIANHAEHAPGSSPLIVLDGMTARDGLVIQMAPGASVRGRVVDAQQRPVASARIAIAVEERSAAIASVAPRQAYSDARGAFEITGLPRKRLAAIARHEIGASQVVAVDTLAGDVDSLTLTLDVTGTISGTVVDPHGQGVENARISVGPASGATTGRFDPAALRFRNLPEGPTDASGRFTVTGLPPGTYRLWATPASRATTRGDVHNGVTAATGEAKVRLVMAPDGSVRGRLAFPNGEAPGVFRVSAGQHQRSFARGDGEFLLDGLAPAAYELEISGPGFQPRTIEVTIESSKVTDIRTITVVKGRSIAGKVVADGQPVAGATVYAGRAVFGTGTTSASPPGATPAVAGTGGGTRTTTTDANGEFSLAGFAGGDVTVVAEHDEIGRSRARRLPEAMAGQSELTITLERFGALRGVLHPARPPAGGVLVSCQSTSSPGAVYRVAAGPDGTFRFDRLAPDLYKVSATVPTAGFGARFYSQQATVLAGKEAAVELAIEPGTVALEVTITAGFKAVGAATIWLASGTLTARTVTDLALQMAAAGPGLSVALNVSSGEPKRFTDVPPGQYSVCVIPFPLEIKGRATRDYMARHADSLATFCSAVNIARSPDTQAVRVMVELPELVRDNP